MTREPPSGIIAGGRENAWRACRPGVEAEVHRRHAAELAEAGFVDRIILLIRIRMEILIELEKAAPRGGLYSVSHGR